MCEVELYKYTDTHIEVLYAFAFTSLIHNKVYCRDVLDPLCLRGVLDPPVSVFQGSSLSLYRHSFLYTVVYILSFTLDVLLQ